MDTEKLRTAIYIYGRAFVARSIPFAKAGLVVVAGTLSVAYFFRYQIENQFTLLLSDRYDGVIEISILEHWYNVLRGKSLWSQTNYFFPVHDTLAYNDGYLIYGLIYSIFRSLRIDPFLSGEAVSVVVRAVGFPAFYFACLRILKLNWKWALLGATLFTVSNNSLIRANHQQLLSVSFVPLLGLLLYNSITALAENRSTRFLAWGSAFVCLHAAWLMTSYYMAWYFVFYGSVTLVILVVISPRSTMRNFGAVCAKQKWVGAFLVALTVLINVPFLLLYLPKAIETGMHPYREVLSFSPALVDVVHLNMLFGNLEDVLYRYLRPGDPVYSELSTGLSPGLLFVFVCAIIFLFRKDISDGTNQKVLVRALAFAAIGTWATILHVKSFSAWYFIYYLVPGAKAARVLARYQIFLTAPVVGVAMFYLAKQAKMIGVPILMAICFFLIAEEINGPGLALDRLHELARLERVPLQPPECSVFFVSAARPEKYMNRNIDGIYSHNVDAMLIAEMRNLPTINGFATFVPPGWDLVDPVSSSYLEKVQAYVSRYHVRNLCDLDLKTMVWKAK